MRSMALLGVLLLSGCTISPDRSKPATDYPDASTPASLNEYNGGIIADIVLSGRQYNVVTDSMAAKVAKWQGNKNGFVTVDYKSQASYFLDVDGAPAGYLRLTAIDKGVMFQYDIHGW